MKRRALLLLTLALLHAAIVAFVVWTAPDIPPAFTDSTIAATAVPLPVASALEPALIEVAVPADVTAPDFETASAVTAADGDCAIADQIRAALLGSPATPAALAAIPPASRTVANAVMLWDGRWRSLSDPGSGTGLVRLREVIVASVRAAPAGCQIETNHGPRLVIVPDGAGSVVLAFGSGTWRWSDLLS